MQTEPEYVVITEHIPLAEARKNVIYGTEEPYLGKQETFSEWAMVAAFTNYQVGQAVDWDAFCKTLIECQTQQELNTLVELGLIDAVWDEKQCVTVYRAK